MIKSIFSFFLLLAFFSRAVYGSECLVSMDAPGIAFEDYGVVKALLDEDAGLFHAEYSDGSVLLINYGVCSLKLRAHYFSDSLLSKKSLSDFLSKIIPSRASFELVSEQLSSMPALKAGSTVTLNGNGDVHKLTIIDSRFPSATYEMHYEWIPVEH